MIDDSNKDDSTKDGSEKDQESRRRKEIMDKIKKMSEESQRLAEGKQMPLELGDGLGTESLGEEDIGFDASILNDTPDPKKSYHLYYGIQRMMKEYLPKGKNNRDLRRFVYDEKNLFLNRGKQLDARGIRGSDGRMTYIPTHLEPAFNAVSKWIGTGSDPFDLYMAFWEMNEAHGYHDNKNNSLKEEDLNG